MAWITREGDMGNGVVNVGGPHLSSYLVLGRERTVLIDANMAFMSPVVLRGLRQALPKGRGLDAVLLTHSHFDHVGGLPALRLAYPDLTVYGHAVAAQALGSANAQALIRDLNHQAASLYGDPERHALDVGFDPSLMTVDVCLDDGDEVPIGGGEAILAASVPGHTRCSMVYLLQDRRALFGGESMGVLLRSGVICPEYLSSYDDYIQGLHKSGRLGAREVFLPHFGMLTDEDASSYWQTAIRHAADSRRQIADRLGGGASEDEVVGFLKHLYYESDLRDFQPEEAFEINARRAVALTMNGNIRRNGKAISADR